jgi:hypothetical protein
LLVESTWSDLETNQSLFLGGIELGTEVWSTMRYQLQMAALTGINIFSRIYPEGAIYQGSLLSGSYPHFFGEPFV